MFVFSLLGFIPGKIWVLALMSQSPRQFMHHFLENNTVNILSEHVKEEPVTHLALLDYGVDDLTLDQPETDVEEVGPHPGAQNDDGTVHDDQGRKGAKN